MDDRDIKISEAKEEVDKQELLSGDFKHPVSIGYAALVTGCVFGFVALGLILFDAPLELMFLLSWIVVVPLAFIPYCFLNYLTPVIDLIYAKTGFTIKRTEGRIKP